MTTETITFRVDASERADIVARAKRDNVSVSDYIRVRLGLRGDGVSDADALAITAEADDTEVRARLADHERRLTALETGRAAFAAA